MQREIRFKRYQTKKYPGAAEYRSAGILTLETERRFAQGAA